MGGCADDAPLGELPDTTGGTSAEGTSAEGTSAEGTSAGETDAEETEDGGTGPEPIAELDAVDILFVLDNSASMGSPQQRLAAGVDSLLSALDEAQVDWRIGVTTTDLGNPICPEDGEDGHLQRTSCDERRGGFVFNGVEEVDVFEELCPRPQCSFQLPDGSPCFERIDGVTNVGDLRIEDAVRCSLPMGISGCGFESPLEAMAQALSHMQDPQADEFGFMRPDAHLMVVLVSDEADCSPTPELALDLFSEPNPLWSDPDTQPFASSAVCWNAGVQCEGSGAPYDGCSAVDRTLDGELAQAGQTPVLRPLDATPTRWSRPVGSSLALEVRAECSCSPSSEFPRAIGTAPRTWS